MFKKSVLKKAFLSLFAGISFCGYLSAENTDSTIRLSIPVVENSGAADVVNYEVTVEENSAPTTTGFGISYIFPFRLGLGYTSLETKYEASYVSSGFAITDSGTVTANFLDVSYTFGSDLRFTLGYGILLDGKLTIENEVTNSSATIDDVESDSATGSSIILDLGYKIDNIDLVLGLRSNTVNYDIDGTEVGSSTSQINIGAGYAF